MRPEAEKNEAGLDFIVFPPEHYKHWKMAIWILATKLMISYEEYVTKTSKGNELEKKKVAGRSGAERGGAYRKIEPPCLIFRAVHR